MKTLGGWRPSFAAWVKTQRPKLDVEAIKRTDDVSGLKALGGRAHLRLSLVKEIRKVKK